MVPAQHPSVAVCRYATTVLPLSVRCTMTAVRATSTLATYLCDIGTEQLGTGVHAPLKGQWSWLGLAVTEEGDVVVADMDQACVYRI